MTGEDEGPGPPNYGLTEEQVASFRAMSAQADVDQAEIHRLRGEYLSVAASIEGLLNQFLAMYYLRNREDEADQQKLLDHWYSWLLGRLTLGKKLELVEQLCKDGLSMEKVRASGMPAVLVDVRQVNIRRNQLAHSSVGVWPVGDAVENYRLDIVATHINPKRYTRETLEAATLAEEVETANDVMRRLHNAWFESLGVHFPFEPDES